MRKLCLACGLHFLALGAGYAQKLDLIQEPCITGGELPMSLHAGRQEMSLYQEVRAKRQNHQ
ncbi:MAG: hypothetical protein EBQ51_05370 [Verrucomicrobia bacterium]|nr:hypothetical protein [Verrucomicrobiota bacterium]